MVHGNYYGAQYEIYLKKKINFFDDVLPICIDVKKMISLQLLNVKSDIYKLVIIPYRELDKRLEKRANIRKYVNSLDQISGSPKKKTRKTNPEIFKYIDVKIYTDYIKHSEVPEPYTEEHVQNLENKLEVLKSKYDELHYWEKYSSQEIKDFDSERSMLEEILRVQRIIKNKTYFEEIQEIERELTSIELTDGEKELITRILEHPKLEGAISWHGINLIDGFY